MTVELCIVFPAAIAIAVIATNALLFFGQCAEFDRTARNAVRTYAASPAYQQDSGQSVSLILSDLESSFNESNLTCEASVSADYRGYETYNLTLAFEPTLFGLGLRSSVFGVGMPVLRHEVRLTVDPYKPGMLF